MDFFFSLVWLAKGCTIAGRRSTSTKSSKLCSLLKFLREEKKVIFLGISPPNPINENDIF